MKLLSITILYAGLLGLFYALISFRISMERFKLQAPTGNAKNAYLERYIRGQANCGEYIPIFLILMLCHELNLGNELFLHAVGSIYLISRIVYYWGYCYHEMPKVKKRAQLYPRIISSAINYTCLITLSLVAIYDFFDK